MHLKIGDRVELLHPEHWAVGGITLTDGLVVAIYERRYYPVIVRWIGRDGARTYATERGHKPDELRLSALSLMEEL